ncbi:PotD/PotF family extracellular solute-binding protein [Salipiger marinus]|uniref:ABC transporter substrate-binding protein n=1 Tax=Salipiger marinus TaxID=555512 RepID=UPI001E378B9E|nr:spermidine/putrescine ABC transporter substrate-binding protein [Salipiger manganoxidans]MCD1619108.1 spermidine/putrescine ABC transporter substrate-binding protein [Salipiger manganoxidans]MEB3420128.1 spermidine/putrescine ABC transporter substrate-binding protein [Salipiger manganoxidans]
MKPTHLALTSALVLAPMAGAAQETLSLYNWGDYINPEVLDAFTEETGIAVTLDTYGSNEEMLAKIQAGATGYDIVFPSVHMHDILFQLGLLAKTDIGQAPGFENIDPQFIRAKTDPEAEYCLPYAWGNVGIVYNKALAGEITSWEDFFALGSEGQKITLLDDLRETIGIGLIMTGSPVNSTDPAEVEAAADYIVDHLQGVTAFTYDSVPQVISGDVAAAHWYVGANIFVADNSDTIAYVIPEEGATLYQEDMCVLASAPNPEAAKKFLEFYLRPEIAALNVKQQMNGTPNIPAQDLIPAEIASNPTIYPPQEVIDTLQIFEDLGRDLQLYNTEWTRIKTAQ